MIGVEIEQLDIFSLEEVVWLAVANVGVTNYDFVFDRFFACRRPWQKPERVKVIGRFGVTTNYSELYNKLLDEGIELIHSPEQYLMASELTSWYPLIKDLTPLSIWFREVPSIEEIEKHFNWPIFIKGNRQTSKHKAALSIANTPSEYLQIMEFYKNDPILHWQTVVCREFIPLRMVEAKKTDKIAPAFEFRTFWWKGQCVGFGPYWAAFTSYSWTRQEEQAALAIAKEVAIRVNLPFLVVDVAQTATGKWIVIECNDGQESGYAGISPISLWHKIIEIERSN